MDRDDPEIIVCAGPPACLLMGDDAKENMMAGCPMCRHIVVHEDGTETEYKRKSQ